MLSPVKKTENKIMCAVISQLLKSFLPRTNDNGQYNITNHPEYYTQSLSRTPLSSNGHRAKYTVHSWQLHKVGAKNSSGIQSTRTQSQLVPSQLVPKSNRTHYQLVPKYKRNAK